MLSEPGNGSDAGAASTLAVYKVIPDDMNLWGVAVLDPMLVLHLLWQFIR